jgi:(p)ppGpp synthase/HD superfamily hydrolase
MTIVEKARVFATAAHAAVGQLRKYTNEPYIVHPFEVAMTVKQVGGTPEMIAAAFLHDTVEDTHVTLEIIEREFGPEIKELVFFLTDASKPEHGNRATRKAIDREHISRADARAQTIKLADIVSNCTSIVKYDPEFAKVYLEEKRLLLEVLTKGDKILLDRARKIVN